MIETTKDMISVWMGTSFKTPDEFNEYTDGMEDSDSHCPAFADFGVSFIDSDYFVAFQTDNGEIVPVEVLAEEVGAHSNKVIKDINGNLMVAPSTTPTTHSDGAFPKNAKTAKPVL
ncbi:MAG: hypothetical protein E6213_05770 [Veillonella sp.]|nr:hypothetical protein [Veillonella sp.]